jgi:hypothetical protein
VARRAGYVVAALPALLTALLLLLTPSFMQPLFDDRITLVGLPLGVALLGAVSAAAALGLLVVHVGRSPIALIAVVILLVLPSVVLLVFAPAIVFIAINLQV